MLFNVLKAIVAWCGPNLIIGQLKFSLTRPKQAYIVDVIENIAFYYEVLKGIK